MSASSAFRERPIRLAGSVLGAKRHICGFFRTPEEEYQLLLPFIKEGIERGEKAFHVVDPKLREDHLRRLESAGIDVAEAEKSGQFELCNWAQMYLRDGRFDQDRMLAMWRDVLVAAGRQSNTSELNLAAAGLTPGTRGLIKVDAQCRTEVPHIFAAGDVIGPPALATTGMEQARMAMCVACEVDYKDVVAPILPTGIYTIPEASMAGETEDSLAKKGVAYVVGRARYRDNPRGCILGDESGLLKLIFARDDMRLLGVHVVGEQATELVQIGLVAMMSGAGADLFNRICFNYPTLGDLYKHATYEAILKRDGRVVDPAEVPADILSQTV